MKRIVSLAVVALLAIFVGTLAMEGCKSLSYPRDIIALTGVTIATTALTFFATLGIRFFTEEP